MQLKYTNLKIKPKYYIKFIKSTVFHETELLNTKLTSEDME